MWSSGWIYDNRTYLRDFKSLVITYCDMILLFVMRLDSKVIHVYNHVIVCSSIHVLGLICAITLRGNVSLMSFTFILLLSLICGACEACVKIMIVVNNNMVSFATQLTNWLFTTSFTTYSPSKKKILIGAC